MWTFECATNCEPELRAGERGLYRSRRCLGRVICHQLLGTDRQMNINADADSMMHQYRYAVHTMSCIRHSPEGYATPQRDTLYAVHHSIRIGIDMGESRECGHTRYFCTCSGDVTLNHRSGAVQWCRLLIHNVIGSE